MSRIRSALARLVARARLPALLLLGLTAATAGAQQAASPAAAVAVAATSVVTTEQVRAELMAHAPDGLAPGRPLWLGLQLRHKPQWHTYWKNSGDSGLPTELRWTLPAGLSAGAIAWPTPHKIPVGPLANYGYEGTVLLPVPVTIGADFRPPAGADAVEVRLHASWLVCRQECIPEEGRFTLRLPLRSSLAEQRAAFEQAWNAAPRPLPGAEPGAIAIDGALLRVTLRGLPESLRGRQLEFFPETPEVIETAARWSQRWQGGDWLAEVPIAAQRSNSPQTLPVVVAAADQAWRAELPVRGAWPAVALPGAAAAPARPLMLPPAALPASLLAALAGALVGGLILNLMPCVFPVLAIKLLAFARPGVTRRQRALGGLAYTGGAVAGFLLLAAVMLALRGAGEGLGWGFQLQEPGFVAALALLFTLIGLNLAGVFEVGQLVPGSLAGLQARHPVVDAALTGVLAVVVASPCTAPFMGAALGLAIGLPAWQALAVFGAVGLGLALPYLAASLVPGLARRLPRPGAWMALLRRLLAFPMFATVAWLVWVLGQQSGIDGAGALLALLVAAAFLAWALALPGRPRIPLSLLAAALLAALAWGLGSYVTRAPAEPVASRTEGAWQPWAPGRVEQLLAQGKPVLVDFTAAWCVTCQVNKGTTLGNPAVLDDLARARVTLLRADWTRRDPAITAALAQLGRNGVPVYVLYDPRRGPVLLPEILSRAAIRDALAGLTRP